MRAAFLLVQALDGVKNTHDHVAGRLPRIVRDAGFRTTGAAKRWRTAWGSIELFCAERPAVRPASREPDQRSAALSPRSDVDSQPAQHASPSLPAGDVQHDASAQR